MTPTQATTRHMLCPLRLLTLLFFAFAAMAMLLTSGSTHAAETVESFDNAQQEQLYKTLLLEYRCLKCQNQNLADSNASLAGDLRREILTQLKTGKSKTEIDEYLVSRYGEFVLYRPRFSATTALLWIGPFVLFLIAISTMCVTVIRRRRRAVQNSGKLPEGTDLERLDEARQYLENP